MSKEPTGAEGSTRYLPKNISFNLGKKCSENHLTYSDGNQSQQWRNSGAAVSVQVHHLIVIIDILYTLVFCYVVQSLKPAVFIVCKSTKKLQKSSKPANWLECFFCFNPLSGRLEKILLIVLTMHYTNKQKKRSFVTQEVAGRLKKLLWSVGGVRVYPFTFKTKLKLKWKQTTTMKINRAARCSGGLRLADLGNDGETTNQPREGAVLRSTSGGGCEGRKERRRNSLFSTSPLLFSKDLWCVQGYCCENDKDCRVCVCDRERELGDGVSKWLFSLVFKYWTFILLMLV